MSEFIPENENAVSTNPIETSVEVCRTPCSKDWHNPVNESENGICDNNYENCYTPNASQEFIYNIIDWKSLRTNFDDFLKEWLKSAGVKELLDDLLPLLVYKNNGTPFEITTTIDSYQLLKLIKDDKCNDINYSIVIRGSLFGGDLRLFHIAFHSKEPKVTWGSTRRLYTCGYYEKQPGSSGDGSGEFHYKIDSIKQKIMATDKGIANAQIKKSILNPEQQPYKKFLFEPENLLISQDSTPFINTDYLPNEVKNDILDKHTMIYRNFIDYWNNNTSFQQKIRFGSTSAVEENAGGRRRRRSQKYGKKSKKSRRSVKTRKMRRRTRRH
jgi:hypothetical protein